MEYYEDEEELVPEYSYIKAENYNPTKRPSNALDYMKFNSEDYLKYKFERRVREQIKGINLDERIIKEIMELSYFYYKKLKSREFQEQGGSLKVSDIIAIVTYKLIKKHSLPFTHGQIYENLKLDKKKYLKFSNLFSFGDININEIKVEELEETVSKNYATSYNDFYDENSNFQNFHAQQNLKLEKEKFYTKIFNYLNYMINSLSEICKYNPSILKLQIGKNEEINLNQNLNKFLDNFKFDKNLKKENIQSNTQLELISNNKIPNLNFTDNLTNLQEIKLEAKRLIYEHHIDIDFFNFFNNKFLIEIISAGIIKVFLERKGIKINLQVFKDHFRIPGSSVSKATKLIYEFMKIVNYK
jgi:hypothetical protein